MLGESAQPSDISDHLGMLFFFAVDAHPRLIVELGTRGGESTRALLAAAHVTGARLLSIDLEDCGAIGVPYPERWDFVQADDVEFGRSAFRPWCRERGIAPQIDVLFIDTSHHYDHTKREIEVWKEHLSASGSMLFHDTNMGNGFYRRTDGSVARGWNNRRGVIRAIEEALGREYDERSFFCDVLADCAVLHFPYCNGLTIVRMRKRDPGAAP